MQRLILVFSLFLLASCGSDGESDDTATSANSSDSSTETVNTDASCYYVPDPESEVYVNVGEVGAPEAEEAVDEFVEVSFEDDALGQSTSKAGIFIATCYGDINYTTTVTTYPSTPIIVD